MVLTIEWYYIESLNFFRTLFQETGQWRSNEQRVVSPNSLEKSRHIFEGGNKIWSSKCSQPVAHVSEFSRTFRAGKIEFKTRCNVIPKKGRAQLSSKQKRHSSCTFRRPPWKPHGAHIRVHGLPETCRAKVQTRISLWFPTMSHGIDSFLPHGMLRFVLRGGTKGPNVIWAKVSNESDEINPFFLKISIWLFSLSVSQIFHAKKKT